MAQQQTSMAFPGDRRRAYDDDRGGDGQTGFGGLQAYLQSGYGRILQYLSTPP